MGSGRTKGLGAGEQEGGGSGRTEGWKIADQ